ncbi:MAG: MaoC/PaaZ C-terminal domain-containing protein [Candidatus Thiodiazotropha sp. L084R]
MSLLHFEQDELQSWADYSGDYNPIHFDEAVARAIGQKGVVMHGMLAMLPIKTMHSDLDWTDDGWLEWKAMLRDAMPLLSDYRLESRIVKPMQEVRFKLSSTEDEQLKISGRCTSIDFDTAPYTTCKRLKLPTNEAKQALQEFTARFPSASASWVVIDAMIFSHYICHHADEVFKEAVTRNIQIEGSDFPEPENVVAMQTHHNDIFSKELLRESDFNNLDSFEYSYYITDEILSKDSVYLIVEIPIWINRKLLQVVQLGLMARLLLPAKT